MKYALRHLYDLPLSPYEESQEERHQEDEANAFFLGNLLHDTLFRYHRCRKTGIAADACDIFERLCTAQHVFGKMKAVGRAMLENYLKSPLACIDPLDEEKEFNWRLDDGPRRIILSGKIDRLHYEGDSLKIVDYKAGAPDDESHRLQLAVYRLAMENILGAKNVATSNFYFSSGEERLRKFTDEELRIIRSEIIEDARRIASEDFEIIAGPGNAGRDCDRCEYGHFCPSKIEEPQ